MVEKLLAEPTPAGASSSSLRFVDWMAQSQDPPDLLRKGDRRRLSLKLAAAQLLEDRGYDAFSTGDVSDKAQVTRTAFYVYFSSKQALTLDLLEDFQRFMMSVLRPARKGLSLAEAAYETNLAYIRFFAVNARIILSVQNIRRSLSDAERLQFDMNDWWAHKVARTISNEHGKRSAVPSKRALATAYALEAMIDGFLTELYVRNNPHLLALKLDQTAVAHLLTDLWLRASGEQIARSD